jgi:SulP family sulfate permease
MKPELFSTLKGYSKKDFFSDLTAGLLVAIVALPLSIAMGIQSGATLQAGLISAIIGGFLIAALGGSRYTVGGPSATFILVTLSYIAAPGIGRAGLPFVMLAAGVILIAAGLLRAGKLLRFVPFPIVTGFSAGIGVILIVGQLPDFFGLTLPDGNPADFVPKILGYAANFGSARLTTAGVGIFALAVMYILQRINKKIPAAFAAVALSTLLAAVINPHMPEELAIATIGSRYGDVKPEFNFLDFGALRDADIYKLIPAAFIIALLSALEGLMSATSAEGMTGNAHDPNTELIGHGAGNIGAALFCGIPVTGVLARTSANINGGAKTPVAGMFHSVILLLVYLLLMPVLAYVPFAALAAVLIRVAVIMSKFPLFAKFLTFGIRDSIILSAAFILTVFLGVAYGIAAGLALAFAVNTQNFAKKLTIECVDAEQLSGGKKFRAENKKAFRISGAVFFVSVNKLLAFVRQSIRDADEIILDMSAVTNMDATSVERLAKLAKSISKYEKRLVLHNLRARAYNSYKKAFEQIIVVWN